jgi:hypothetical protein
MTNKNPQESNGQPNISGSNGRQPTRSGYNDARNCTAREKQELQAKTRAMYSSAHLPNMNDIHSFDEPLDECLDSRLSDIKACVKQ